MSTIKDRTYKINLIFVMLIIICFFVLSWRAYREYVPSGASPIPFTTASIFKKKIVSNTGRTVYVYYNDVGAAHSGNFWTWVVHWNVLTGKQVVLEGYSTAEIIEGEPRVKWQSNDTLIAYFVQERYGSSYKKKTYHFSR